MSKMRRRKTFKQDAILVRFLKEHKELVQKDVQADRLAIEELWDELVDELNQHGPPERDVSGWKRVFCDWRLNIRKKLELKFMEEQVNGSTSSKYALSRNEEVIAGLCGLYTMVKAEMKGEISDNSKHNGSDNSDSDVDIYAPDPLRKIGTDEEVEPEAVTVATKKRACSKASCNEPLRKIRTKRLRKEKTEEAANKCAAEKSCSSQDVAGLLAEMLNSAKEVVHLIAERNQEKKRHHLVMEKLAAEKNEMIRTKIFEEDDLKELK